MRPIAPLAVLAGALCLSGPALAGDPRESTCVTCHEAEEDESLSAPVREWLGSVHAAHDVSCDACHGGDPRAEDADESMSEKAGFLENPSWMEMADFCGACHEAIAERYRAGHFGRQLRAGVRVATCATCHMPDGHRTLAAQPEDLLTEERCPECPGVEGGPAAVQSLREVRARERAVAELVDSVEGKGIQLTDLRGHLRNVRAVSARSLHELDPEVIDAASRLALMQLQVLEATAGAWEREADRRRAYGLALLSVLGLLFAALLWLRRQLGRRR